MLIVEDDDNLSRGIAFSFEKVGFEVACAGTVESVKALLQSKFDIIILDLGLPDGDGIELCRNIRKDYNTPIIILTARDLETDEVQGFSAGADDYVTKPFSLSVLRARVEAVLRRLEKQDSNIIQFGEYRLDVNLGKLYKKDVEIPISTTEFRLLNYFSSNAGQILTKEQILAALWDNQGNFVDENTLSVNISRLRAKIEENPKVPKIIKTIRGMGYIWAKG
jgi:DNA-binding response OmpR family regulator